MAKDFKDSPGHGQRWSGARRTTYTHEQHLADVMRDAQRISEESRQNTLRHIERMQEHLERTATITFTNGVGGVLNQWTGELDANTADRRRADETARKLRERREQQARERNEANLVPGMRVPEWLTVAPVGSRCDRSITSLHDSPPPGGCVLGAGRCVRPKGHGGRHIAATSSAGKIFGVADRLDETPKAKPKTAPRTPADTQLDTPVSIVEVTDAYTGKVTSRYKGGRRIPDTPPGPQHPVVEVGKPCPADIPLSQGQDRCLFGGGSLDDLLCSRKTGHDGNHIATAGDVPGAEVLAVCAE